MPEYLAPGVYVEEIEIGARPIEGVSTSTAGFLGYAERGPLNKPTLVTSFADFGRIFGGYLPAKKNGKPLGKIRWLAYAVSGFFENGGKRAYITRVAKEPNAKAAKGLLPKLDKSGTPVTLNEDVEAKNLALALNTNVDTLWTANDVLLLSDGTQSEYLEYKGTTMEISFQSGAKLASTYKAGTEIQKGTKTSGQPKTIETEAGENTSEIELDNVTNIAVDNHLLIEDGNKTEVVVVTEITDPTIKIANPLRYTHAVGTEVFKLITAKKTTLCSHASKDGTKLYVDGSTTLAADEFIIIGNEYIQISAPLKSTAVFQILPALKYDHKKGKELIKLDPAVKVNAASEGTWGDSIKLVVKQSSLCETKLEEKAEKTERLDLETVTGIEAGSILKLSSNNSTEYVTVSETHKTSTASFVILTTKISGTFAADSMVQSQEFDLIVKDIDRDEVFKNLSLEDKHSRYIKKIVTEKSSNLIRIGDVSTDGDVIVMPTPDDLPGWRLETVKGDDGFPVDANDDKELNTIFYTMDNPEPDKRTALNTFKNVDEINIVAMPGMDSKHLQGKLITHCEVVMGDRFAVLDPGALADLDAIKSQRNLHDSSYAALYYPWISVFDSLTKEYINVPPSGHVCGIYARSDVERGVHKAPANEKINGVFALEKLNGKHRIVNKGSQEILNPLGINCIRQFPGRGIRVWGARTVTSNSLWKYINVRRLFLYLEESIEKGTQWVVFEPNDEKLWARVIQTISQFLTAVWKSGALMGSTPEEAFFIKCDRTTMTQSDIDNGKLICLIGVAPVKPAEFVIFRIAQWQGGSAATE